jgi:hypothetical protein
MAPTDGRLKVRENDMDEQLDARVPAAWGRVRAAIFAWNFGEAEQAFHEFCEAHHEQVPDWFADEYAFTGMRLWASGRAGSALRHFAMFFDRAVGSAVCWHPEDAELLAEAEPLAFT